MRRRPQFLPTASFKDGVDSLDPPAYLLAVLPNSNLKKSPGRYSLYVFDLLEEDRLRCENSNSNENKIDLQSASEPGPGTKMDR